MLRKLTLSSLLLLTACAGHYSEDEYRTAIHQWIGQPVSNAVLKWGQPTAQGPVGPLLTLYTWRWTSSGVLVLPQIDGAPMQVGSVISSTCEVSMWADPKGTVVKTNVQGECAT